MRRLFLSLAITSQVSAQETMIRQVFDTKTDTHVEVLALFSKPSPGGYLPVRVKIANNLTTPRSVQLVFESGAHFSQSNQTASSFGFSAAAGKTVTRDILVPLSPSSGSRSWGADLEVRMSGSMGQANYSLESLNNNNEPAVLLSDALFTPNASALDAAAGKSSSHGRNVFAAKFDPKQLPDSWLAFSGYDSVLMTDSDWNNTPAGSRNAILSWARLGGQLLIYSNSNADQKSLGLPADASFGSTVVKTIPSDLKLDAKYTLALVGKQNPNKSRNAGIKSDFSGSWPLQKHFGSQTFRYGLFIAVLIVFAIVVGPVNLFVFAKSGQRHKLFITTPLISLAASLILITLIIVQDGFGGYGMRRVLMEVRPDGDQNAAYIHQEQFSRTGVLTGSRFTIAEPCYFTPVPIATSRWARHTNSSNSRGNFNIQPDDGKLKASGDWFQSRSEHGHLVTAVVPTRGRIERASEPDTLVSTFEFPIETLFYHDQDGKWFRADTITTGKRFRLTPVEFSMVDPAIQKEIYAFAKRNQQIVRRIYQRPGCYLAVTAAAPGIATHPGIRWRETRTVITGPVITP